LAQGFSCLFPPEILMFFSRRTHFRFLFLLPDSPFSSDRPVWKARPSSPRPLFPCRPLSNFSPQPPHPTCRTEGDLHHSQTPFSVSFSDLFHRISYRPPPAPPRPAFPFFPGLEAGCPDLSLRLSRPQPLFPLNLLWPPTLRY